MSREQFEDERYNPLAEKIFAVGDEASLHYVHAHRLITSEQRRLRLGLTNLPSVHHHIDGLLDISHDLAIQQEREDLIAKVQLTRVYFDHMIDPRKVANGELELDGLYGAVGDIASPVLAGYDAISPISSSKSEYRSNLKGMLQEITFLMLMARRQDKYSFAVPSTLYEDALEPNTQLHIDAHHFQRYRGATEKRLVQVKSSNFHSKPYHPSICIVTENDLGNAKDTFSFNKRFHMLRDMIDEVNGVANEKQIKRIVRCRKSLVNKILTVVPSVLT